MRDQLRQCPSRRVRPLLTAALALLILAPAPATAEQPVGEIISGGSAPFTESWDQMRSRDALQLGMGPAADGTGRLRVHNRPIDPRALTRGSGPPSPIVPPPAGPSELVEPRGPGMIGAAFEAISLQDQFNAFASGSIPPDTMGAIGPSHFLEVINSSVAVFSRQGAQLSHVSLDSFFFLAPSFPRNGSFDPRVLFDRRSDRWFAIATEFGNPFFEDNDIILAVSRTNDPTGTWDKYVIPLGVPSGAEEFFTDFPSLAVDDNGVYFGATIFPSVSNAFVKIAATPKASLIAPAPSLGTVTQFSNITDMFSTPQPANNHDAIGPSDPAWFMASSTLVFGDIVYRTLTWNAGVPTLSATTTLTSPAYAAPINAPANGSGVPINVGDDRIQNAVIRNDRLWTCRNVGVNIAGTETNPNRTACEWFELNVAGLPASIVQRGRVFDAGNPQRFYYYPSIMVNGLGHVAMGFSGSRSNEFVGAYATGRLASDPPNTMVLPILLKAGTRPYDLSAFDSFGRNRWGDYSYTSLDPNDDMSFWTIQEFATGPSAGNIWSTWVAQGLGPGPAVPTSVNPPELEKGTTTDVTIGGASAGGTAFYDPGAGFANRLMVAFDGGGITVNSVTFNGPTQITANITVDAGAASGGRGVTVTNPDGQSASSASPLLTLLCNDTPPLLTDQPQDAASCLGAMASFSVAVTSPTPLTFQWRKDGVNINGATGSAIVIDPVGFADQGNYDVLVNNECASITSDAASLNALSPEILGSPGDLMIKACETVTLGVLAEGPGTLTYQWHKDGLDLVDGGDVSGATTPSLSIKFVTLADAGVYDVLCTSDCGPILSNSVELKIVVTPDFNGMCPDPAISLLIANAGCAQCNPGGTALLSAALVGCGILVRRRR